MSASTEKSGFPVVTCHTIPCIRECGTAVGFESLVRHQDRGCRHCRGGQVQCHCRWNNGQNELSWAGPLQSHEGQGKRFGHTPGVYGHMGASACCSERLDLINYHKCVVHCLHGFPSQSINSTMRESGHRGGFLPPVIVRLFLF